MSINFISFVNLIIHARWFGDRIISNIAVWLDDELYIGFSYYSGRWLSNINASELITKSTNIDIYPAICTYISNADDTLTFKFKSADMNWNINKNLTLSDMQGMMKSSDTSVLICIMPEDVRLNSEQAADFLDSPMDYIEIENKHINISYKEKSQYE